MIRTAAAFVLVAALQKMNGSSGQTISYQGTSHGRNGQQNSQIFCPVT
jgi:hypothetical protein